MALFSTMELTNLQDLLVEQLRDLYDAENRLVDSLPKMEEAASDRQLKDAFRDHLKETKNHVSRLEAAFKELGEESKRESCEAMKGLVKEAEQMVEAKGDPAVKDAALIAAAQRVEHYEMAGYGAARSIADELGHHKVAQLLQETLSEEGNADKTLTKVSESWINVQAAQA